VPLLDSPNGLQVDHAAAALWKIIAGSTSHCDTALVAGAMRPLVDRLRQGKHDAAPSVAAGLRNIASTSSDKLVELGGIGPLVVLLRSDNSEIAENAAAALSFIAMNAPANCDAIAAAGAVGPLEALLASGTRLGAEFAAAALRAIFLET